MNDSNQIPYSMNRLPLASLDYVSLVAHISQANRSISAFGTSLKQIPNPAILLSPLILGEAVASSKIENINTTIEEVLKHKIRGDSNDEKHDDIMEVINYRHAISEAVESLEKLPLTKRIICQIHKTLLSGVRGLNKDPGNFRSNQVQIASGTGEIIYTPPPAQDIPDLFGNLENYMHGDEADPLVQAAIVHAQFELIHPFLDGNGRTGRILIPLFLYYKKVIDTPMFYLSEYFQKERSDYYLYLNGISRQDDWLSWIKFFLVAVTEQSKANQQKIDAIQNLYKSLEEKIGRAPSPRYYVEILKFIFSESVFNAEELVTKLGVPKSTCFRILAYLLESGSISSDRFGKRNFYFFDDLHKIIRQ